MRLLERPTTILKYGALRSCEAHVVYDPEHWPPYDVTVTIDANQGPVVQNVIHELLHVVFSSMFVGTVDDTLEEVFILAIDTYMSDYVKKTKSRHAKWVALIEKKLAESTKDEPCTLEEMADRT